MSSSRIDETLIGLRSIFSLLGEAMPTWQEKSPEDVDVERFKGPKGKVRFVLPGKKQRLTSKTFEKKRGSSVVPSERLEKTAKSLGARTRIDDKPESPATVGPRILKRLKKLAHKVGPRSTLPRTKPEEIHGRKDVKGARKSVRGVHGGGQGRAARGRAKSIGGHSEPYDPLRFEDSMSYVPRTFRAAKFLAEDLLMEKKGRYKRRKAAQAARTFPEEGGVKGAPKPPPSPPVKGKKKKDFRELRRKGKIKGHKEKTTKEGKKKYTNPTTFKPCPEGALISARGLRHSMPLNTFVNPDPDYPTYPIRPNCRASIAGVARSLQYANPSKPVVDQVLKRADKGEIRGARRIKLWGTGVGGRRMKTHRGPPGKPKRDPDYGTSTGEPDERLHTARSEHGKAGNREVPRASGHASKSAAKKKVSKRKQKRQAAGRKTTIARGKRTIGRRVPPHAGMPLQPTGRGAAEAEKFQKRAKAGKKAKKTHKKSKGKKRREKRERQLARTFPELGGTQAPPAPPRAPLQRD